jgi:sec-independent protein translocase protein TatA
MGLENPLHIAIILLVVLMVFGAKRLPEMGKGLGEGMRSFKSSLTGEPRAEPAADPHPLSAAEEQPRTAAETEQRAPAPVA